MEIASDASLGNVPPAGSAPPPPISSAHFLEIGRRKALIEALLIKSPASSRAVGMISEAWRAVDRNDGPECLHVAGYEIREFMNALPRAFDLPILNYTQLTEHVQRLSSEWRRRKQASSCSDGDSWRGEIDDELLALLRAVGELVRYAEENAPARRAEAEQLVLRLAPTSNPMPSPLLDRRTGEWTRLLRFFNGCTHHSRTIDREEFLTNLAQLEDFLFDHLLPRTFDDQDEIDLLIREVEGA